MKLSPSYGSGKFGLLKTVTLPSSGWPVGPVGQPGWSGGVKNIFFELDAFIYPIFDVGNRNQTSENSETIVSDHLWGGLSGQKGPF